MNYNDIITFNRNDFKGMNKKELVDIIEELISTHNKLIDKVNDLEDINYDLENEVENLEDENLTYSQELEGFKDIGKGLEDSENVIDYESLLLHLSIDNLLTDELKKEINYILKYHNDLSWVDTYIKDIYL